MLGTPASQPLIGTNGFWQKLKTNLETSYDDCPRGGLYCVLCFIYCLISVMTLPLHVFYISKKYEFSKIDTGISAMSCSVILLLIWLIFHNRIMNMSNGNINIAAASLAFMYIFGYLALLCSLNWSYGFLIGFIIVIVIMVARYIINNKTTTSTMPRT